MAVEGLIKDARCLTAYPSPILGMPSFMELLAWKNSALQITIATPHHGPQEGAVVDLYTHGKPTLKVLAPYTFSRRRVFRSWEVPVSWEEYHTWRIKLALAQCKTWSVTHRRQYVLSKQPYFAPVGTDTAWLRRALGCDVGDPFEDATRPSARSIVRLGGLSMDKTWLLVEDGHLKPRAFFAYTTIPFRKAFCRLQAQEKALRAKPALLVPKRAAVGGKLWQEFAAIQSDFLLSEFGEPVIGVHSNQPL